MNFRVKLTVTILLLIAVSFGLGGTMLIYNSFSVAREKESRAALCSFQDARTMIWLLYHYGDKKGEESVHEVMHSLENEGYGEWMAVRIYDSEGVIYEKGPEGALEREPELPEADRCAVLPVNDGAGYGLVLLSSLSTGKLSSLSTGNGAMRICARYDLSDIYALYSSNSRQYLVIYAVVAAIGMVVSVALSFALTDRLHRLTRAARRISRGELSVRSGLEANDEFGELSQDFDRMADSLQEKIGELEDEINSQTAFTGAFAHEIKTPMTSIIGFADILRQGDIDENTRIMAADYIYSEGQRLERLSFKLLDLLLMDNDETVMKETELTAFLKDAGRMLSSVLRKRGIRLSLRSAGGTVLMEPDLMKSLIYNLIDNAAKAIDGEGRIDVSARALPDGAVFVVRDNGRGMEQEELAHITEAFYRVDKNRSRSQGGAGLGLALCRRIVELHSGTISFESAPGRGTAVTVTIKPGAAEGGAE